MKIFNKKVIIVGITIILLIISGVIYAFMNFNDDKYIDSENNNLLVNETISEKNQSIKIKAEIKGEVISPGVYEFDEGSRLKDLIDAAGGFSKKAYYDNINLSMKLKDEMVVVVYDKDNIKKKASSVDKPNNVNKSSSTNKNTSFSNKTNEKNVVPEYNIDSSLENNESVIEKSESKVVDEIKSNDNNDNKNTLVNKLVNINTAGIKELSTLTGIGEAKAQKIIDYREANGGFKSIDEIMKVKGIGKATYEKFKANITI
mgnify:FL=1